MKRLGVFIVVIVLALVLSLIVWLGSNAILDGVQSFQYGAYEEVVPVVVESSCVDDLQAYNNEVEARINTAVLLEQAQYQAALETALGPMQIFEDGSFRDNGGNGGCIPYTLCDAANPTLWYPQDVFVLPH